MKTFFAESKIAIVLLVLVTALSGITHLEVESDKPALKKIKIEQTTTATEHYVSSGRAPASIEPATTAQQLQTLENSFFCNHTLDEKKQSPKISASMVMLNFKVCKDLKNIESVAVYNETNGFKAQIFKAQNSNYKTDYIQLSNGSNKLVVEVVLKDGQKNVDSLVILTGS